MKKFYFLALSLFIAASCSNDDDSLDVIPGESTGNTMTYDLSAVSDPDVSGSVLFVEKEDGSTDVSIVLSSTTQGSHPAHIHLNTAAEGGDIAIDLEPVDGPTRRSLTNITQTNDGTSVSYDDLINFDGYRFYNEDYTISKNCRNIIRSDSKRHYKDRGKNAFS